MVPHGSFRTEQAVTPARSASPHSRIPASLSTCIRCGFPVPGASPGCKNPCLNCGTIYPLGDCSD
jgi:hypothetical protein